MAKIRKHFTVTKHLPKNLGRIEFNGIVYNNDPENYEIDQVFFHMTCNGKPITEQITSFFTAYRSCTDPYFHHEDICNLLADLLAGENNYNVVAVAGTHSSLTKNAA